MAAALALIPGLAVAGAPAAAAPSGLTNHDYTINFQAAAPLSYNHQTGGGAWNGGVVHTNIVSQLQSTDFKCGDTLSFLTQITQDSSTAALAAGKETLQLNYSFTAYTTGQEGSAIVDVLGARVNYPPAPNLLESTTVDSAIHDDGDSAATFTRAIVGPLYTNKSQVLDTVTVTNFSAGEALIVRVDALVGCQPGSSPTGNMYAQLDAASIIAASGSQAGVPVTINTGAQTVTLKTPLVPSSPAISINKLTNGSDSSTILIGTPITWTYAVKNTGDVDLTNVHVTDNQGVSVSCPSSSLAVGVTETCTATGVATTGWYSNIGTAHGDFVTTAGTTTVTATDPSSYFGASPAISINKLTNGSDGPYILTGDTVTWTYLVTNTGNVPLSSVGVTDNQGVSVSCPSSTLAVAASETCTATGVATAGPYSNVGTASGTYGSRTVTATDPSNYYGAAPAITISKLTNGVDSATIMVGETVTWTYLVTNTGNVTLSSVGVTDNMLGAGAITCPKATLAVSESMTCTASGVATAGWYYNTGTASGGFGGRTVTATDPSSYFGAAPAITINKLTNGADGAYILSGDAITWTYFITNTGNIALSGVGVTDSQGLTVTCGSSTLAVGASETCTATGTAISTGAYSNIGTVSGTASTTGGPRTVTASDPSSYFGSAPGISINKLTNGSDGPFILTGDTVTWTYLVTNTGNVDLSSVGVTDNRLSAGSVTCPSSTLAVGTSETCTATGVATAGSYTNTGTASGSFLTRTVTATDDSSYFGAAPAISISKLTNGVDSATIMVGETVTWTYLVTNTGNVTLSDVGVVDTPEGAVTCPKTTLAVSESMTCTASGVATAGWYYNTGTASGGFGGRTVTASDPSSYFGAAPAITISKLTNGSDGPFILTGDTVTWTYFITNSGNIDLANVFVTDNQGVSVTCTSDTLTVGSSETCTATGVSTAGAYSNIGTVSGTASTTGGPRTVTASDPSSYFGAAPAISIAKLTNGVDSATIQVGETVTWTYLVTNTGNVDLSDVGVTDNPEGAVSCPSATLAVGASETCTATGIAVAGPYSNVGTASGGFGGRTVTASDPSSYFGADPAITISKLTNGVDSATILLGDPVNWTYFVTNTGNIAFSTVVVTDDQGVTVTCPSTGLAVGASETCTASGVATTGWYHNLGTATGNFSTTDGPRSVTATDPSSYFGADPHITISKLTNGVDSATIRVGETVTWTYLVTNTGNIDFKGVAVTDDQGVSVSCPSTGLAVGASETCTATGVATADWYHNIGTATGTYGTTGGDRTVQASDPSSYFGADPAITISKLTNGVDSATILVGETVTWTYFVTNTGNIAFSTVVVTDDQGVTVSCPSTGLDVGASETCTATGVAVSGPYSNVGTATGNFSTTDGPRSVTASDPSSYFGASPAVSINKLTNGSDGPFILTGDTVTWTYFITNTGNVPLSSVGVTDDQGVSVTCGSSTLAVGASETCTATGVATPGAYSNIGTVNGTASTTGGPRSVTASDPSSYYGASPGISINKLTNGSDSSTIIVGTAITWTYLVTNTGNVTLNPVSVTDSKGVAVTCPATSLAAGASETCTATGVATVGWYSNVGTASGGFGGNTYTANDPSSYFGAAPAISVVKSPASQFVTLGDTATFTILVTNTGNVPLTNVTVSDPLAPNCNASLGTMAVGDTATYSCTLANVQTSFTNVATATGTFGSTTVTATGSANVNVGWYGRTPGYWKNHPLAWPSPYAPTQTVRSVFTIPAQLLYNGKLDISPKNGVEDTLIQALAYQGGSSLSGKAQILLRAAVAGLLNEAYYGNLYPPYKSTAELIAAVNACLATLNGNAYTTLAATLDYWNNGNHNSI